MKKLKYSILILLLLGCDAQLELKNPNEQTTADTPFWVTSLQALAGVDAVYQAFIYDGTYQRMTPALMDGRGDDFRADSPWPDLGQVAGFIILPTSGPVDWVWSHHFMAVWRANQVLDNVPAIDMDEALKTRVLGQAYFLRGLAYFNLVNFFKEVPLITKTPLQDEDYFPATATEDEIWAQIISDFATAKDMLPVSYAAVTGPDKDQVGRATKGSATGFLGKAYLYRKQWAQAAAEFEEFFSGGSLAGVYSLTPDYRHNFDLTHENNSESLFEIQFSSPEQVGGSDINWAGEPAASWMQISAQAITYSADGYGFADFLPTRYLYDQYKSEQTIDGKSDPRLLATICSYESADNSVNVYNDPWPYDDTNPADTLRIYARKYTNNGLGKAFEEVNSAINYRVLRYADILLMYAEAQNELGNQPLCAEYIQMVRDRANLPDREAEFAALSQTAMRDQIAHERLLEFAIESQRINDLIRWGWFYDPVKLAELKLRDPDFNTWEPGNEYLPIPQGELDTNPRLSPNSANE